MNIQNIDEAISITWDILAPPVFNFLVWSALLFVILSNIIPSLSENSFTFAENLGIFIFVENFVDEFFICNENAKCDSKNLYDFSKIFGFAKESTFYFILFLASFIILLDIITKFIGRIVPARLQIKLESLSNSPYIVQLTRIIHKGCRAA